MPKNREITTLIDGFLTEIKKCARSDTAPGIGNYVRVARTLRIYASKNGYELYSKQLMENYDQSYSEKFENGTVSKEYYRFICRFSSLFSEYAETGTFNYSVRYTAPKRFPVDDSEQEFVDAVMEFSKAPDGSYRDLEAVIRHIVCYIRPYGKIPDVISDELLLKFYLEELPKSNKGSLGRSLRCIKLVSEFLKCHGRMDLKYNFTQLQAAPRKIRHISPYTKGEIKNMLDVIDTNTADGKRIFAMIICAYETALRGVDIRRLKLSDVDWRNQMIRIKQSKTGIPITVPLSGAALNALADYILECRPADAPFEEIFLTVRGTIKPIGPGLNNLIETVAKRAGIQKIEGRSFHSLRRACASDLSAAGVDIETISQYLGHTQSKDDRPYLTYNRSQIQFCAMGFEEIPLNHGIYADYK